ncbi:hypothetical protein [Dyella sp. SG609]|uniref:hypothetical protein n=1 Tax=Dyella sp. SG609 TaxID=2587018 RepID=UPI0017A703A6|nr:hypothetical protein [Dyella sp. SG609]NKJ19889.1 hypothetical protein [Dyella sp. SG609]
MKRYLIEPTFLPAHEPGAETGHGTGAAYRIVDTRTQRIVPAEGDDIGTVARACARLNEVDEQAGPASPNLASGDSLPDDVVQSIAISNAKSLEAQPAILANLELAQQVFNQNLRQQNAVAQQQAMNLIRLAVVAKCVSMIESADGNDDSAIEKIGRNAEKLFQDLGRSIAGEEPSPHAP